MSARKRWLVAVVLIAAAAAIVRLGYARRTHDDAPSRAAGGDDRATEGMQQGGARADKHGGDPASLAGTVRAKAGHAIAGAWVCATPADDDLADEQRAPRCVTTGSDDAWSIDSINAGHWSVNAGADG